MSMAALIVLLAAFASTSGHAAMPPVISKMAAQANGGTSMTPMPPGLKEMPGHEVETDLIFTNLSANTRAKFLGLARMHDLDPVAMMKVLDGVGQRDGKQLLRRSAGIAKEEQRRIRNTDSTKASAHAAAEMYNILSKKKEEGKSSGPDFSLSSIATEFGVSITQVRVARANLSKPFDVKPPGNCSLITDDDLFKLGERVVVNATNDNCLPWTRVRKDAFTLAQVNSKMRAGGQTQEEKDMTDLSDSTWYRVKTRLVIMWERLGLDLTDKKRPKTTQARRINAIKADTLEPFFFYLELLFDQYPDAHKGARKMNTDER
jgi:hypothetical protein